MTQDLSHIISRNSGKREGRGAQETKTQEGDDKIDDETQRLGERRYCMRIVLKETTQYIHIKLYINGHRFKNLPRLHYSTLLNDENESQASSRVDSSNDILGLGGVEEVEVEDSLEEEEGKEEEEDDDDDDDDDKEEEMERSPSSCGHGNRKNEGRRTIDRSKIGIMVDV